MMILNRGKFSGYEIHVCANKPDLEGGGKDLSQQVEFCSGGQRRKFRIRSENDRRINGGENEDEKRFQLCVFVIGNDL